ncbi:MAG: peptide deformylase [Lachnospiraceae bacterium]|nr:peptide deformylase [Lachnospiraceae bacterium]
MAVRTLRIEGDPILNKKTKEVKELTPRLEELIDDMIETMNVENGVGIAAPQVGVLRKIFIVDIGEGTYVFINPEILETEGEQVGDEGCLSVPGKVGTVVRPEKVKIKALGRDMQPFELEAEGFFARAICHENDHLEGVLYSSKTTGGLRDVPMEDDEEEPEIE